MLFGDVPQPLGGRKEVSDEDAPEEVPPLLPRSLSISIVVLLVEGEPGSGKPIALDRRRAAELLAFEDHAPLHDGVDRLAELDLVELVVDLLQDLRPLVDPQDEGAIPQHLVLDEGVSIDQLIRHVLVEEGVLVEAGGKEAAELRPVASHGGVGLEGEAEDFEDHNPSSEKIMQPPSGSFVSTSRPTPSLS